MALATTQANNPIIAQFADEPAFVHEGAGARFEANVRLGYATLMAAATAAGHQHIALSSQDEEDAEFWAEDNWAASFRPYNVKNGILRVPVQGALLNKFPYSLGSWLTGYDYIEKAISRGLADPEVKGIALDVDSPGGMCSGCFELADFIRASNATKPIKAFVDESSYSAAYALSSAAGEISATKGSGVGSIGVVTMHVDFSKMLDEAGIKITFIHAGKYKVEGNSYEPLSDGAKARIQTRIDALYQDFVSLVARNRGLDEKAVRDTEAQCYRAADGLNLGLIDKIAPTKEAVNKFQSDLSTNQGVNIMSKTLTPEEAAAAQQTAVDTARAEGVTEGTKAGAAAERARISGIVNHANADKRAGVALSLALDTDLTVEQAAAVLAKTPEEATKTTATESKGTKTPFEAAMDNSENPDVGADSGKKKEAEKDDAKSHAARIIAAHNGN